MCGKLPDSSFLELVLCCNFQRCVFEVPMALCIKPLFNVSLMRRAAAAAAGGGGVISTLQQGYDLLTDSGIGAGFGGFVSY
jgi:hypothetical protein